MRFASPISRSSWGNIGPKSFPLYIIEGLVKNFLLAWYSDKSVCQPTLFPVWPIDTHASCLN